MIYTGKTKSKEQEVVRFARYLAIFGCAGGVLVPVQMAEARTSTISTAFSMQGTPGLIDMPSAEVAPEGAFSLTYGSFGKIGHATLNFQVNQRLSIAFRYSSLVGYLPLRPIYTDRSLDLAYRILDETDTLPAIKVGINDFLGTGFYSGEYVVATKSLMGDRLRLTGGLGWGRLGSRGALGAPFGTRPVIDFGLGGTIHYQQWFRGPVAPFGGISYRVNDKLTLMAEYSSDGYVGEDARDVFNPRSPFSFGANYQVFPGINVAAYYLYGAKLALQFSIMADPNRPTLLTGRESAPLPVRPRPSRATNPQAWDTAWTTDPTAEPDIRSALAAAMQKDGLVLESMSLSATSAEIRVTNLRYGAHPEAIGRVARMMTRAFPASVETFTVTLVENGVPLSSVTMSRSDVEALEHAPAPEMLRHVSISDPAGRDTTNLVANPDIYPKLTWSIQPYLTVGLFDPNYPVRADVGLRFAGRYEISPGLILSGSVIKKIAGNLDQSGDTFDSVLPHVRSEAALYAQAGDPAIERLTFAWYTRPAPNLYGRVTLGYLEPMFAGISTELLWKRVDSRFALGAELNWVKQRDYNQLFGFRDYSTVTGHVSAYYSFDQGYQVELDVGRYLAGDYGATIAVDRVFGNGWRVGAYATVTNLSAEEFGEGTFDKGIRFTIPMEWALGTPTRAANSTTLRSLSSDGGARLEVDGRLFDWVQEGHEDALAERWGRFWR